MVFSSAPTHVDPPNWNQQQLHPGQLPSVVVDAHQQQHQLPPVWPLMAPQLGTETAASEGVSVLVRPGSMAERARLAKIPLPEPGLKCPRCDSTNTKFCYFNNYSLTQPRHFCKACRRYWTRGGALRSVPVGGVCRRNKRKKSSKHSSSLLSSSTTSALATGATVTPSSAAAGVIPPQLQPPSGSLHPIWSDRYSSIGESRLGFPGLNSSLHPAVDYQLGDGLGLDRWRLQPTQQFPFLTPADSIPPQPSGLSLMSFDDAEAGNVVVETNITGSGGLIAQMASVKMDDNPTTAATSSPRDFPGLHGRSQFCGTGDNGAGGYGGNGSGGTGITGGGSGGAAPSGGAWSDLSAFKYSPR